MKGISICYCILFCLVLIQVVWSQEDEEAAINAQAEQQSALISNALGGAAPSIESYIASKSKHVRKPDDETDSSMKSDKMKKKDAESEAKQISMIASQQAAQASCPNVVGNNKLNLNEGLYHIKVYNSKDNLASSEEYLSPLNLKNKDKCIGKVIIPEKAIHDEKYCFKVKPKKCGLWEIESIDADANDDASKSLYWHFHAKTQKLLLESENTKSHSDITETLFKITAATNDAVEIKSAMPNVPDNGGTKHQVVKIVKAHLSDPSYFDRKPDEKDNTMTIKTACMFYKMHMAAKKAGVLIRINSGFRTVGRQQYFWNLYKSGKGNLAARPGTSRHGIGTALDLNTNCGRQNPGSVPSQCKSSNVYCWMINNAHKYNFKRTVANEPWHWEFTEGWNAGPVNGKLNHNGRNIVYGQFSHEPQPGDPNQKCKKNIPGTCTTPEQCQSNGGQTKGGACNGGSDNVCCVSQ